MAVRRCAALGAATAALMITNHHAQWFPNTGVPLTATPTPQPTNQPTDPLAPKAAREDTGRYPEVGLVYDP